MVSVLTENWTMTDPRDLRGIVRMAQEAEDAGFDMVMVSDHVLLGPSAGDQGRMANPRDYAMPGNQDPATPWPSNIVLLSAIAAATTRIRIGGEPIEHDARRREQAHVRQAGCRRRRPDERRNETVDRHLAVRLEDQVVPDPDAVDQVVERAQSGAGAGHHEAGLVAIGYDDSASHLAEIVKYPLEGVEQS